MKIHYPGFLVVKYPYNEFVLGQVRIAQKTIRQKILNL